MAAADADRAVPLDEVGVADGEIWFAQCVNVLLLFTAWSRTAFSLVYTLTSDQVNTGVPPHRDIATY